MLTNIGLVDFVKTALSEKWGYVWGTFGGVLTEKALQEKITQYPEGVGNLQTLIRSKWLNKRTADCVGLIKSYLWWRNGGPVYEPSTDVTANDMFGSASVMGTFNSFPIRDVPGLLVWKDGHIGVYIGGGWVIEAHGTPYGVIKTPLRGEGSTPWTHWCQCPFIRYEEIKMKDWKQIIKENSNGSADEWVKAIDLAVLIAEADKSVGDLEIFKYLPTLIEKIGNK